MTTPGQASRLCASAIASASFVVVSVAACQSSGADSELGVLTETIITELEDVSEQHVSQAEHCIQSELLAIEDPFERFTAAFECGDELFEVRFNALDGVGANVGGGQRFTRVPRADRTGDGEWLSHSPARETGPNAEACNVCHSQPFDDGAGLAGLNVIRDPERTGDLDRFINRNTPHLFGIGALQRLAEEMTERLHRTRRTARLLSCLLGGISIRVPLRAKGVRFGHVTVSCDGATDDLSEIRGVDDDLVIRPLQWKGINVSVREFNRGASHNELGMQPIETVGVDVDGDGDGVLNEMGVGDQSALAIYLAAQPRPVTKLELADLGLIELTEAQRDAIRTGERLFTEVGCARCHRPRLRLANPVFTEPSQNENYRDLVFPSGLDPREYGVVPEDPIAFDLTTDQPDNVVEVAGQQVRLGSFEPHASGGAIIRLFSDLKRHDMGQQLAESVDEAGTGASVWLTKELWGVGSTAPYLHDGRATTLTEAILEHGGEASSSRSAALALSPQERADMIAFLDNLILFKIEDED